MIDFIYPGKTEKTVVMELKVEKEQYNNAAQNYHFSYSVRTEVGHFTVSKEFYDKVMKGDDLYLEKSVLFNEVNMATINNIGYSETHIMRWLSGGIFPAICLMIYLAGLRFNRKVGTLVFVGQALLIGDIVYLML